MQRIVRLFLALAVAFVFTGRMEAAAQHCSRLAHADDVVVETVTDTHADMACHDGANAGHTPAPQTLHEPSYEPGHEPGHHQISDACECIAVMKACTAFIRTTASVRIEPYEWTDAEAILFASIEPAPDFRPPRA